MKVAQLAQFTKIAPNPKKTVPPLKNGLFNFREKIATEKRRQYIDQNYWGKPITGYGDTNAQLLMIGLAPAAHGGNRTGRVFTGDKSADFLLDKI